MAALRDRNVDEVGHVTVLTQHPEMLLEEKNWECGCGVDHASEIAAIDPGRLDVVKIESWDDADDIVRRQFDGGKGKVAAVVSCLGHRQPGIIDRSLRKACVSHAGNRSILKAMNEFGVERSVVITSVGVEEDWPAMEMFALGRIIMSFMFLTIARKAFKDLTNMERLYTKDEANGNIDYLFVRPVGISEDAKPCNDWVLQKGKYKDPDFGKTMDSINMAKMDVARYMVQEALKPTRHRSAVVIGGRPKPAEEAAAAAAATKED